MWGVLHIDMESYNNLLLKQRLSSLTEKCIDKATGAYIYPGLLDKVSEKHSAVLVPLTVINNEVHVVSALTQT